MKIKNFDVVQQLGKYYVVKYNNQSALATEDGEIVSKWEKLWVVNERFVDEEATRIKTEEREDYLCNYASEDDIIDDYYDRLAGDNSLYEVYYYQDVEHHPFERINDDVIVCEDDGVIKYMVVNTGFINNLVPLQPEISGIYDYTEKGYLQFKTHDSRFYTGIMDYNGIVVLEPEYRSIIYHNKEKSYWLASCEENNDDFNCKRIISIITDGYETISKNKLPIYHKGYIDDRYIKTFDNYIISEECVGGDNRKMPTFGICDIYGNTIVSYGYSEELKPFVVNDNVYFIARGCSKYGVLSTEDKAILDFEYDYISFVDNELYCSKDGNLYRCDLSSKTFTKIENIPSNSRINPLSKTKYELVYTDDNGVTYAGIIDKEFEDYYAVKGNRTLSISQLNRKGFLKEYYLVERTIEDRYIGVDKIYTLISDGKEVVCDVWSEKGVKVIKNYLIVEGGEIADNRETNNFSCKFIDKKGNLVKEYKEYSFNRVIELNNREYVTFTSFSGYREPKYWFVIDEELNKVIEKEEIPGYPEIDKRFIDKGIVIFNFGVAGDWDYIDGDREVFDSNFNKLCRADEYSYDKESNTLNLKDFEDFFKYTLNLDTLDMKKEEIIVNIESRSYEDISDGDLPF